MFLCVFLLAGTEINHNNSFIKYRIKSFIMGNNHMIEDNVDTISDEVTGLCHRWKIPRLFNQLWESRGDMSCYAPGSLPHRRAGLRRMDIYNQIRHTVIRLYEISETTSSVLRGIDPAWAVICCVGALEELPISLRESTQAWSWPLFDTEHDAIRWWFGVRKRELEVEWMKLVEEYQEIERARNALALADNVGSSEHSETMARLDAEKKRLILRYSAIKQSLWDPLPNDDQEEQHEEEQHEEEQHEEEQHEVAHSFWLRHPNGLLEYRSI